MEMELCMADKIWQALANEMAETAASAGRSVVAVHGRRHASSGIFWSDDAVVTVHHALRHDEQCTVTVPSGERVAARVAGRDASTDLAVLRLQEPVKAQLPHWAGNANLRVGELVLALARTARGNIVASSGVLSGLMGRWRTWRGGEVDQFIRPDLTLYSGFSGGPLLNAQGEVLGMNTAALHRTGITIPASTIRRVAAELLEKGRIERPYLGLAMQAVALPESLPAKLNLKATEGLLVVHVETGSPADKGGVLLGDVLLEIGGEAVADTDAVLRILQEQKSGNALQAKLLRAGTLATANVTLLARPAKGA
jgi:S1-C subfamily serine protease